MNPTPLLLSALSLMAPVQEPVDDGWSVRSPMRIRVDEILEGRDEGETEQAIRQKLLALGTDALPELIDLLMGVEAPAPGVAFADLVQQGGGHDELLLRTLESLPSESVVAAVRDYTMTRLGDKDFDDQLQSMVILGRVGDVDALEPMFEIIARAEPVHLLRPTVQNKIEQPLSQILLRDPRCLRKLSAIIDDVQVELWPLLARAIGANMRHEGIDLLEGMLGHGAKLDGVVLEQLSRLDPRDWREHGGRTADILRKYLHSADRRLRKQAVTSLGQLRYVDAFEDIIVLLDDIDRSVAQGAAHAVQSASGLSWKFSSEEWQTWFSGQQQWLQRIEAEVAPEVLDPEPHRAIRALRTLSERPVFRNRLSEIVAQATTHPDEGVVLFACSSLSALDSPYALSSLVELLAHDSDAVRSAALESLELITGQELDPDHSAWRAWLES